MSSQAIGIFDSGIGGLGIFQSTAEILRGESIVYFADSNRCPYGPRTKDEIKKIAHSVIEFLINEYNIKLAVLACNTATVSAISYLRESFSIPFVGVVPVIKPASLLSKSKNIGCLATDNTVKSEATALLIQEFALDNDVHVHNVACHGLVDLIEEGIFKGNELSELLKTYISPLLEKNVDAIALGCTHYTLIRDEIEKLVPANIKVMDSNEPVAKQVKRVLESNNLLSYSNSPEYHFVVNGSTSHFGKIVGSIIDEFQGEIIEVDLKDEFLKV